MVAVAEARARDSGLRLLGLRTSVRKGEARTVPRSQTGGELTPSRAV